MSIRIALAGNPNCGKTTLFNDITGSKQHVGNWPGVTVEQKTGKYKKNKEIEIVDLPGIYSLSPYSAEEIVARDYIVDENPDVLIDIVDGTNIERNLYLTLQVLETKIPTVIALNMMDEVEASGAKIDVKKLSKILGVPVIPIVARSGKGINELIHAFVRLYQRYSGIRLLLVGSFDSKLDPLEENTYQLIHNHEAISFVGFQEDVRPCFAAADVLTFPSYREGFPNVVLQAGAMGLPAIVTDISGCNEIIEDGVNGTG